MQQIIEQEVSWNDMIGEWQLRGIAYTGNNMMKRKTPPPPPTEDRSEQNVYLVYGDVGEQQRSRRPRTGRKKKKSGQVQIDKLLQ